MDAPPYVDWIRHLAEGAPLGAIMIKITDNEDNKNPRLGKKKSTAAARPVAAPQQGGSRQRAIADRR